MSTDVQDVEDDDAQPPESPEEEFDSYQGPRRPGLPTLVKVELRKMGDTRAGFWLLVTVAALSVIVALLPLLSGDPDSRKVSSFFQLELFFTGVVLPVLGVLTVTQEWGQRTALTTFTLVPHRERVLIAKLVAAVLYAVASVLVSLVVAYLVNLLAVLLVDSDGSWALPLAVIGQALVFQVLTILLGVAFGLAFVNTPVALVLYFVLPTVWQILSNTVKGIEDVAAWLDFGTTSRALTRADAVTGENWAQLGTATLVWVALPLAVGTWRLLRREVK